ncbi:phenylacetic acid degradation protein PaaN [Pontibacter sp. G13]|uniref:phenylacetic acid degradation protein PaaN n=1 Tax=Pontibacter sp. G13 TaxID=3074898 RepID=UPI00288B45F6|nr:phenylacetic acid degradation protein PaaN [Pontibacter sp. G13]WNJ18493.1 phenylacetic acid degradation protein PaaN [Pontibacter sp. G13]
MNATTSTPELFAKHKESLDKALEAVHKRTFYAHYPEPPSKRIYGETANDEGLAAYQAQIGNLLPLHQQHDATLVSDEASPYTQEALNLSYPISENPQDYIDRAQDALKSWRKVDVQSRAALLMESLDAIKERFFELAYATMHTTGQSFMMSFQASGPHALDRAIETIALALFEMNRFPTSTFEWVKPMGKFEVKMEKRYRFVPKGVGLAIGVSTFPVWNTVPGLYADLITGNPVIVKPHPLSIYPIAIVVQEIQNVLAKHGLDVHIAQLATDKAEAPITGAFTDSEAVKLIDFTGGNAYGDFIETLGGKGKTTFTEKAGVNSVILDSTDNLKKMLGNLGFSLSMYSGQMCTCPQNIFIPKDGIKVNGEQVSYDEVVAGLAKSMAGLATHPKAGPGILGAIQNPATAARVKEAASSLGKVLLEGPEVSNPEFPNARLAAPSLIEVAADQYEVFSKEVFGPIAMVIPTENTEESLALAKKLASEKGAISCTLHSTDEAVIERVEEEMAESATPVSTNFTGNFWVNQNAGFSDFHVTGGNPAGNASLTDPSFVTKRFTIVGSRVFIPEPPAEA